MLGQVNLCRSRHGVEPSSREPSVRITCQPSFATICYPAGEAKRRIEQNSTFNQGHVTRVVVADWLATFAKDHEQILLLPQVLKVALAGTTGRFRLMVPNLNKGRWLWMLAHSESPEPGCCSF